MGVLDGKVAIITGAARGQGLAEAERFVAEGASVVLVDVLGEQGKAAAERLGAPARFVPGDVASQQTWDEAIAVATEEFGGLDVLVNNAGVMVSRSLVDTDEATLRSVLDTNLVGAFLGIRAVVPAMRARGGGSIVNTSSAAGMKGMLNGSAYVASKFGLRGLSRAAALELGRDRIRVNCVCPGLVRTEMAADLLRYHEKEALAQIPLGYPAEPTDVADLVLFLASDAARAISGGEYVIDGGSIA
ncbi:SDR family oxidoreductase [Frankia sp. CNm7]|uniref:SDR family oxidoreductase n=1 Tax=Frankia nepalensis TaxID=1836974 RepID=A0A937RQ93_9ACTN|nr:SDR family oxidoreductase [Frankia nepalensis]MBL7501188.1 SDR family oxidoreductase [Frankia nepalensis]MBL7514207.1 SDR family oxidoreductase [Frankia nepalensis]MBL7523068.1 SDR family oxidoreductase [Frankia nepalensis]MBL7631404.1 SDR family oxidoreductase [Frankia nepalensis]